MNEDCGKHYRHKIVVRLNDKNISAGCVELQLDPARIASIYGTMTPMQFTILKKCLRMGAGHKNKRQDLLDIISAAQREIELMEENVANGYFE